MSLSRMSDKKEFSPNFKAYPILHMDYAPIVQIARRRIMQSQQRQQEAIKSRQSRKIGRMGSSQPATLNGN